MFEYDPDEVRSDAPFHVQLHLTSVPTSPVTHGQPVRIGGPIQRLFKGAPVLAVGDRVSFEIYVLEPDEWLDGQPFVHRHELEHTPFVEVYLKGQPPDCELVAYEFEWLSALTSDPVMRFNPPESNDGTAGASD